MSLDRKNLKLTATLEVNMDALSSHDLCSERPFLITPSGFIPVREFALKAIHTAYEKALADLEHQISMSALSDNAYHISGRAGKDRDKQMYLREESEAVAEMLKSEI